MKKAFVCSLILALLLLCSCASVSVSYKLSNDNTVSVDYKLVLSSEDAGQYTDVIKGYWESMGFTADSSESGGVYTLSGNKTVNGDSRSNAAAELSSVLMDENSLFYDASFVYTPSYFEDNYRFSAKISLEDIIRKSEDRTIPTAEVQALLAGAKAGEYTLSISLPGDVLKTNADKQDGQVCIWQLKYGEAREIEITTRQAFEENAAHYANLNETKQRDNMFFMICGIGGGALIFIIIIIVFVRRSRRLPPKRVSRHSGDSDIHTP